jgi:hypothetical protein
MTEFLPGGNAQSEVEQSPWGARLVPVAQAKSWMGAESPQFEFDHLHLFTISAAWSSSTTMPPSAPSAEQSFRANLSQFRWARGVTDDSQQAPANQSSGNPFSRFYTSIAGDYIPLRSSEQSNEDEAWFALSRWERRAQLSFEAKKTIII